MSGSSFSCIEYGMSVICINCLNNMKLATALRPSQTVASEGDVYTVLFAGVCEMA